MSLCLRILLSTVFVLFLAEALSARNNPSQEKSATPKELLRGAEYTLHNPCCSPSTSRAIRKYGVNYISPGLVKAGDPAPPFTLEAIPQGPANPSSSMSLSPQSFRARGMALNRLVSIAYEISSVRVIGDPSPNSSSLFFSGHWKQLWD